MLASKIPENRGPEDVRTSPVRSWKVPGEFISLPGSSREVVGGFGEVLVRVYEVQEVSGGEGAPSPAEDFRSLNEYEVPEVGRGREELEY